ncbi:hypothetical protein PAL_GLEAN10010406 [Pteropus alecto]|uniref:Uncharacterized protein n=1 Tax=Pteropus alecto TaxID=9402 RepID=L5KJD1_PTEAL|nr:hypothetical protein PAL_GLEAN10010406 [Pteropus alecto]
MATPEVGQGRAERRWLPKVMPPGAWTSSQRVPTRARVAGSTWRGGTCLPTAPSRRTPRTSPGTAAASTAPDPHHGTRPSPRHPTLTTTPDPHHGARPSPRRPTLTTTVMPSFSNGALSYVTSHTRTTVVAPYFFRSWQEGGGGRQRWGFRARGGDPQGRAAPTRQDRNASRPWWTQAL